MLLSNRLRLLGHRGLDNFVLRVLFFREPQVGLGYEGYSGASQPFFIAQLTGLGIVGLSRASPLDVSS
jgi:hypothetical protein